MKWQHFMSKNRFGVEKGKNATATKTKRKANIKTCLTRESNPGHLAPQSNWYPFSDQDN